jgi:hypothetical protein
MIKANTKYPRRLSRRFFVNHKPKDIKPSNPPILLERTSTNEENLEGMKLWRTSTLYDNPKLNARTHNNAGGSASLAF